MKKISVVFSLLFACTLFGHADDKLLGPGWLSQENAPHRSLNDVSAGSTPDSRSMEVMDDMGSGESISTRITELCFALENDPVKIYEYVRNTVDYVPYFGSLKGAARTLLDRAGNDADQADLLVQLLRAAGYEAGFVTGTMTIPMFSLDDRDLSNWLGVYFWDIGSVLDSGGIAYDDAWPDMAVYRVWVRVWVDGTPCDLDPAFKNHRQTGAYNILQMTGYNRNALLSVAGGTNTADYAQGLDDVELRNVLTGLTSNLCGTLRQNFPNSGLSALIGERTIVPQHSGSLPSQLHFPVTGTAYFTDISDPSLLHSVILTYGNIEQQIPMRDIAETGLTLRFSDTSAITAQVASVTETAALQMPLTAAPAEITLDVQAPQMMPPDDDDGVAPMDASHSVNLGQVYNRSPYNEVSRIIYQTYNTYQEGVTFSSNPQGAFSDQSFSDTENGTHRYNVRIRLNGSGQSPGTKTAQAKYSYRFSGWLHVETFDLTGEVVSVPLANLGVFYYGDSTTLTLWQKVSGATDQSVTLDGNSSGAYSVVSDSNYVKVRFSSGQSSGTKSATVVYRFTYNGWAYTWVYDLTATVAEAPSLVAGSYSWGSPPKYSSQTTTGSVHLVNSGSKPVNLTGVSITGADASKFALVSGYGAGQIAAGSHRDIGVSYRATGSGIHTNAMVHINFTYDGQSYSWDFFPLSGQTIEDFYAQLWSADELLAEELAPMGVTNMTLSITHPYGGWADQSVNYPIKPGGTYAVITGFGSSSNGELLKERQTRVKALRASGLDGFSPEVLSESLHIIGQTWLQETSLHKSLLYSLLGIRSVQHHRVGVVAQEEGYYVDVKAQFQTSQQIGGHDSGVAMRTGSLLASALEHGCLEQLQSSDRAAVSTVKLLNIANEENRKIYSVDSNNWNAVSASLQAGGYTAAEIAEFDLSVHQRNGRLILPEIRDVTLGDWSGKGYVQCETFDGINSIAMIIGGDYFGGYGAYQWDLDTWYMDTVATANFYDYAENAPYTYKAADPVDMTTGAYTFTQDDLKIDGPLPLILARSYNSSQRELLGPAGYGWTHTFNVYAQQHSAYEQGFGLRTPEEAASVMIASSVMQDLLENEDTAAGWTASAITAQWAMDQLTENAVSIYIGSKVMTFIRQPDGSFTSPPGMTVSLSQAGGVYVLQERNANTYTFNTNNRISEIADPAGNTVTFSYNAQTNLQAVVSSFGPTLTFGYTGGLLTSVTDNSSPSRTVQYQYDSDSNLTNFVDAAGQSWAIGYDDLHQIIWTKDPEQITTIRNFYNSSGQVTNQISASGQSYTLYFTGTRNVEENPLGQQTAYYIDDRGRTWSIERPDGSRSCAEFDGQNHQVKTVSPAGVTNTFSYDTEHNLLVQTSALGTPAEVTAGYGYDAQHHLRFETNAIGTAEQTVTEYTYTGTHHVDTVTEAKGTADERITDFDYFSNGLLQQETRIADPVSRITSYTYDGYGNPDTVASTDAGTVDLDYNARGELTKQKDAKNAETQFVYDNRGLLLKTIYPDGSTVSNVYYKNGLLQKTVDAKGGTVSNRWNSAYKLQTVRYPDGGAVSNTYDAADRLIATKNTKNQTTSYALDAVGRAVSVSSAYSVVESSYDPVGNITNSAVDPHGLNLWTATAYDDLNRPVSVQSALSAVQSQYDLLGRLTNRIDQADKSWGSEYDALGRKTGNLRPSGATEQFVYDALGNRIGFYNAEGKPITFGFDAQGRVTAITNAIGKVTRFTYDVNGNMISRQDAKAQSTQYSYDSMNRLTNVVYQGLSRAAFSYDANGNLLNQQSAIANQQFSYDSMNRLSSSLLSADSRSFAVTNSYDLNGNRTNIVYPSGLSVGYSYDAEDRLTSVTANYANETRMFSFSYDGASRLTNITYPNGVSGLFSYDAESKVTGYSYSGSSNFISRSIIRDPRGFKTHENISQGLEPLFPEGEQRMVHNAADQLTKITQRDTWLGGELNQWYDRDYTYDNNGCLTQEDVSRPEWNTNSAIHEYTVDYSYDYDNRLTAIAGGMPVSTTEYIYDASGVRIGRAHNSVTNYFVIDYKAPLKMPLAETDAEGNITRYYIWSSHGLLAHLDVNPSTGAITATRYYHSDEQGSTLALTDENGTVTDQFAYTPYGGVTRTGTTQTPFQWLGGIAVQNEGDGLYYMLNRYYSATTKKFISADPKGIDGGANLYAYGDLNPLAFVDPYGLESQTGSSYQAPVLSNYTPGYSQPQATYRDYLNSPESQRDRDLTIGGPTTRISAEFNANLYQQAVISYVGAAASLAAKSEVFQTGVNVTPRSVANEYRTIGQGGRTFVTEPSAVEDIVGSLNRSRIDISLQQARQLENALGLNANSLETRNIISVIDDIPSRVPGSPITGNSLFQGGGTGLPGGGSELTIQGIPSAGGPGIRQIILGVGN